MNICTPPNETIDGIGISLTDPCRGQLPIVQASGSSHLRLNDNIPGEWTDDDFNDGMWNFFYRQLAVDVEASYTYIGSLTSHDVGASINNVFLERTPGQHVLGVYSEGTVLPVTMHDFTQSQTYTATNPQIGWTQNTGAPIPEPSTWFLLALGLVCLAIRKGLARGLTKI